MSEPRGLEGSPPASVKRADTTPGMNAGTMVDGRYVVENELGRGGMGIVYLARDTFLDRRVALKVIAPTWLGDGEIAARFQREAKALASIRSQYVVQVYAFGVHASSYFFAMEYVQGRSLKQILAEHRAHGDTVPVLRSLTILSQIAQGIDAVHTAGIVHRDVKPSNIVIEEHTGRPVLVDFGLAIPGEDSAAALAIGTPQYMAPEQGGVGVPGALVSPRTDVYALGVTAFEILTGVLPFDSTDHARLMRQHGRKTPPALSSKNPDLGPFDKSIARALAKDPADRFPSCTAFAEVLAAASERYVNSILPTLPPPAPGTPPTVAPPQPERPNQPKRAPTFRELTPPRPPQALRLSDAPPPPIPPTPGDTTDSSQRPFHVLVVDDSAIFRKFTVQATQLAFRKRLARATLVQGAGSGEEAVEIANVEPPDLVLLDFDMPGLDGVGTLSKLRALPGGANARVVVLSGRVRAIDRWRFAVLGVSDFVTKPIELWRLVERIEKIAQHVEESERERHKA
ncbi:MAG: protein kinase [Polyangiaceae bacterium]|nr:protein kinase [Polyangiaceae bacterium]